MHRIYGKDEKAFARTPFFVKKDIHQILFVRTRQKSVFGKEKMNFKNKIEELLNTFLAERTDLFLIDLKVSAADDVTVIIDGDNGVSLQDCLDASRAIEFNMDREEHDFSLQVMSAGLSEPLTLPRQFKKNLGRTLDITLNNDEKIQGEMTNVDDEKIILARKFRKPKEIGKGKTDVVEDKEILLADIKKALVAIKF